MALSARKPVGTDAGKDQGAIRVQLVHHRKKKSSVTSYLLAIKELLALWRVVKASDDQKQAASLYQKVTEMKAGLSNDQLHDLAVQQAVKCLHGVLKMVEEGLYGNRIHCYLAYEEVLQELDGLLGHLSGCHQSQESADLREIKEMVQRSL